MKTKIGDNSEEILRRSEKEILAYKYALDQACIVAITDQTGVIQSVNDNFCNISKYNREELIGQDHRIINSGHHPKEYIRNLWVTIANGGIWKGELKNRAKDGSYYWVDTTIIPFLNEEGKPYQYLAIRADITQRKRAEEELKTLNAELETRVAQRTEEIEAFSYSISHDLRAPLRSVNGYAKMLEEDYAQILDDEGRRLLGEVVQNAIYMGELIDDLLAFSRMGKKEISRSTVDMNAVLHVVIAQLVEAHPHKAAIKKQTLPVVMADRNLIQQVLYNYLANATKYSSKTEKPVVEIGATEEGNEIIFWIKDNGAGFEMENVNKLFGVFQRLHSADEFEGTGVGLAIAKRIVNKHGGRVWAEGEPDKGATFYFSLPVSDLITNQ